MILPRSRNLRLGDWLLRLWIADSPWRVGKRLQAWPYRYYFCCFGWGELVLKYAPACVMCLDDEHVLYPGKLCPWCYRAREKYGIGYRWVQA